MNATSIALLAWILALCAAPVSRFANAASCISQGDASITKRTVIRVVDVDGRPWFGATIVLAGRAIEGEPASSVHTLEVQPDVDGRAIVDLIRDRAYDVWAYEPMPKLGKGVETAKISDAHTTCVAGTTAIVRATSLVTRRRVVVKGLDAWGNPSVRVECEGRSAHSQVVHPGADGSFSLPFVPGDACTLFVETAPGSVIHFTRVPLVRDEGSVFEVVVAPPFSFPIRTLSTKEKPPTPCGNVDVWQRIGVHRDRIVWCHVGTSDASGMIDARLARIEFPGGLPKGYVIFKARGPSFGFVQTGTQVAFDEDHDVAKAREARAPVFELRSHLDAVTVKGRVLEDQATPCSHARLLAFASIGVGRGVAFTLAVDPIVIETDERGAFRIDGLASRSALRIMAEVAVVDASGSGGTVAEVVSLVVVERDSDLGDLVRSELRNVDFHVLRSDGFPAEDARVFVGEYSAMLDITGGVDANEKPTKVTTQFPIVLRTDRRGRASIRLPASDAFTAVALQRGAFVSSPLLLADQDRRTTIVRIELPEVLVLRGTVKNRSGLPLPRSRVMAMPNPVPSGVDPSIAALLDRSFEMADREGRFEVGLPFLKSNYFVYARYEGETAAWTTQGRILVHAAERSVDPSEIELEIPVLDAEIRQRPREIK
ncbi:MAG: hypothetical protein KDC95_01455 [Planctomycetes bacterium]|nr:hypothetical protein [Planctomycetota bacterium]